MTIFNRRPEAPRVSVEITGIQGASGSVSLEGLTISGDAEAALGVLRILLRDLTASPMEESCQDA